MWLICIGLLLACFIIIGWRYYLMWKLPYDDVKLSSAEMEERLEIPPRPGIQGIVISGPSIEPLVFSIDLTKAGIRPLDWEQLRRIDPLTDVKVNAVIDEQGRLFFNQSDVLMGGHTEAGLIIQRALKTWVYHPYKVGRIRFWFNLPSKGKKLIIDAERLVKKETIPEHIPIYNGQLILIDRMPKQQIRLDGSF